MEKEGETKQTKNPSGTKKALIQQPDAESELSVGLSPLTSTRNTWRTGKLKKTNMVVTACYMENRAETKANRLTKQKINVHIVDTTFSRYPLCLFFGSAAGSIACCVVTWLTRQEQQLL